MRKLFSYTVAILFLLSSDALALDLGIPVDCEYGEKCFIERYFDHSAEEEKYTDHTCGDLSTDGYTSTDFKLRSYSSMKEGVNVLAGDDGVVKYVRDGMSDISIKMIGEEAVRGRECGNGVIVEHKRGYVTQYCHLKNGSIEVEQGQEVEKGQKLGQVGLSGLTSFPFLAFTVSKDGQGIDPFTGEDPATGDTAVPCGTIDIYPLWDKKTEKQLKYISTALLSTGFAKRVPHAQGAREGKFSRKTMKNDARFLVFWVDIFGIIKGDELTMTITSPDDKVLEEETRVFNGSKIQHFQFVGKKPDEKTWPLGKYKGRVILKRGGDEVIDDTAILEVITPNAAMEEFKKEQEKKKR